jgi:Nitroreductase
MMQHNPVIDAMMNRKSVRKYTNQQPSDEIIETIVRAGQQAPFAGQLYSILLERKKKHPYNAPLLFTICVDMHKMELIMARRSWKTVSSDAAILLLGMQDAAYVAENMVIAAESLGLGSCYVGTTPYKAARVRKAYSLPARVFPMVELLMGYPAETYPIRPRYPLSFTLFEDRYPELTEAQVNEAMQVMDDGYLQQGYYRSQKIKIPIEASDKIDSFTFDNYSWTEHISRKWGQWNADPADLLDPLAVCGFHPASEQPKEK